MISARGFTRTAADFGGPCITVRSGKTTRRKVYVHFHLHDNQGSSSRDCVPSRHWLLSDSILPDGKLKRGTKEMYSDNGTNVREADNELRSLVVQLDNEKVEETIANKVVAWHFYRPLYPSPLLHISLGYTKPWSNRWNELSRQSWAMQTSLTRNWWQLLSGLRSL